MTTSTAATLEKKVVRPTPELSLLVVDDDRDYRESLIALLKRQGFVVVGVASCAQARARLQEQTFDGVLVNDYRGGDDSMGYHADDEPELGPHAPHDVIDDRLLSHPSRSGAADEQSANPALHVYVHESPLHPVTFAFV